MSESLRIFCYVIFFWVFLAVVDVYKKKKNSFSKKQKNVSFYIFLLAVCESLRVIGQVYKI